ncbi:MAG TPA: uroporphyrinogen decarboxylase family protein, partial [Thermoleophilia bacterium]|nr:uroporphyrinogen decarboxylase family protein [Thermoleophilia bacterium]
GCVLDPGLMAFGPGYYASWAQPEVLESLEKLIAAGKEAAAWFGKAGPALGQLQSMGFPLYFAVACQAPFDYMGDELRGTKEILLDLYRRPAKVIEACERLAPMFVRWVTGKAVPETPPCVFWPLHKGAEGFLSLEQFETFYWPSLRAVALGLIDEGFIPVFFGEGAMDSRLEIIARDLPKGRSVWILDRSDMAYAKATLGKVAALQGNVPLSLLQLGEAQAVTEYCRKLIEVAAPGGGFLLDSGAVIHQGKAENVRAMVQAAHDFGVY